MNGKKLSANSKWVGPHPFPSDLCPKFPYLSSVYSCVIWCIGLEMNTNYPVQLEELPTITMQDSRITDILSNSVMQDLATIGAHSLQMFS